MLVSVMLELNACGAVEEPSRSSRSSRGDRGRPGDPRHRSRAAARPRRAGPREIAGLRVASGLRWAGPMRSGSPPPLLRPALIALAVALAAGCAGDLVGNEGFEIDCDGRPCDWKVVEGEAAALRSWHDGDAGLDLSGSGRVVVEQRVAPFQLDGRELLLRAALVRRGASLRFELDWYVAGAGQGPTFWDREPIRVDSRGSAVEESGVFALEELVSTPSLEVSGLVLRAVKDGEGAAILDEVSLVRAEALP
jgi:hypothetical protein